MAGRAFEIAVWTASETYLNDPSTIEPVLEVVRTVNVPHEYLYLGLQLEKPQIHLFIGWESVEAHEAAKVAPGNATASAAAFGPVSVPGSLTFVHTFFVSDPTPALRAPVTEVAWLALKAGVEKAKAVEKIEAFVAVLAEEAARADRKTVGGTWGEVVEKPGHFSLIVGFESKEAHMNYLTTNAKMGSAMQEVLGLMEGDYGHVKLASAANSQG